MPPRRRRSWRGGLAARGTNVVREDRHRLALARPGCLVHDDLKPIQLALHELPRQQVQARRIDRHLEHGMARAIETDELAPCAAMQDGRLDARTRRRAVNLSDF